MGPYWYFSRRAKGKRPVVDCSGGEVDVHMLTDNIKMIRTCLKSF